MFVSKKFPLRRDPRNGVHMAKQLILPALIFVLLIGNSFAAAQQRQETDPRLEKLAKEFYRKAKLEGALVVYTVSDVDHIRSRTEAFTKRFPGKTASYRQATHSEVTTRTLTDYQGNQPSVDV